MSSRKFIVLDSRLKKIPVTIDSNQTEFWLISNSSLISSIRLDNSPIANIYIFSRHKLSSHVYQNPSLLPHLVCQRSLLAASSIPQKWKPISRAHTLVYICIHTRALQKSQEATAPLSLSYAAQHTTSLGAKHARSYSTHASLRPVSSLSLSLPLKVVHWRALRSLLSLDTHLSLSSRGRECNARCALKQRDRTRARVSVCVCVCVRGDFINAGRTRSVCEERERERGWEGYGSEWQKKDFVRVLLAKLSRAV